MFDCNRVLARLRSLNPLPPPSPPSPSPPHPPCPSPPGHFCSSTAAGLFDIIADAQSSSASPDDVTSDTPAEPQASQKLQPESGFKKLTYLLQTFAAAEALCDAFTSAADAALIALCAAVFCRCSLRAALFLELSASCKLLLLQFFEFPLKLPPPILPSTLSPPAVRHDEVLQLISDAQWSSHASVGDESSWVGKFRASVKSTGARLQGRVSPGGWEGVVGWGKGDGICVGVMFDV